MSSQPGPLQSKGGILSKACDYIQELRQSNHRLSEELQGLDQLQLDNDVLRQQVLAGSLITTSWERGYPDSALTGTRFPPHRWRISRTRTCCCVLSCATTGWRSSSRMTATNFEGNIGLSQGSPPPCKNCRIWEQQAKLCLFSWQPTPKRMELGAQRSGFGHGPGVILVDLQGIALATPSRQPSHVPECRRLCALGACVWERIQ